MPPSKTKKTAWSGTMVNSVVSRAKTKALLSALGMSATEDAVTCLRMELIPMIQGLIIRPATIRRLGVTKSGNLRLKEADLINGLKESGYGMVSGFIVDKSECKGINSDPFALKKCAPPRRDIKLLQEAEKSAKDQITSYVSALKEFDGTYKMPEKPKKKRGEATDEYNHKVQQYTKLLMSQKGKTVKVQPVEGGPTYEGTVPQVRTTLKRHVAQMKADMKEFEKKKKFGKNASGKEFLQMESLLHELQDIRRRSSKSITKDRVSFPVKASNEVTFADYNALKEEIVSLKKKVDKMKGKWEQVDGCVQGLLKKAPLKRLLKNMIMSVNKDIQDIELFQKFKFCDAPFPKQSKNIPPADMAKYSPAPYTLTPNVESKNVSISAGFIQMNIRIVTNILRKTLSDHMTPARKRITKDEMMAFKENFESYMQA